MAPCLFFLSNKVGNKISILTFSFVLIKNKFIYYWIFDFVLWDFLLLWYCLVKHLDNIIHFLLKISSIWWDKFTSNFKYIFINEKSFTKKFLLAVGKLIKSRVLQDRAGLRRAPKGGDGVRKFPPSCRAERVWGKTKLCEAGATTHPLAPPHCHTLSLSNSYQ